MSGLGRFRPPLHLRRRKPWWLRLLVGLGVVLVLLPVVAGLMLWRTLPARNAELKLPGLSAPVEVVLDAQGIPRIRAATERDAHVALGWLHARDRLFQMELMRRGAAGRLAEIAGPGLLRNDRLVRTLGLARRAEADLATLPPETLQALEAYAEGVNAWIDAHGRFSAPEFLLLGKPEPWLPMHSLLWAKVMGIWLSNNWRTELTRASLARLLPPERLAELWPTDTSPGLPGSLEAPPPPPPAPQQEGALPEGLAERLLAALPRFPAPFTLPASASNAWAVAPARSTTGGALLASDPHLGFQAPILWYLARIELPGGRFLAGATSPGVPFMIIGRNERLAWGFTTTGADTQDLFIERLAGPDSYETPDGPRPFTVIDERILVRGGREEALRVRETRHGPVVSDLAEFSGQGRVLALAAGNLAEADTAAAGMHALNRAGSLAEARAAAARITSPVQNLMLADRQGGIGMVLTGRIPLRRAGDGSLPAPGWDGSHDWTGWAAPEDLPGAENPPSGAVVNANNRVAPPDWPVLVAKDWPGDWRFRRIWQRLEEAPRLDPAGMAAIQMDNRSLLAQAAVSGQGLLRRLPRGSGAAQVALDMLLAWDGDMAANQPQPLVWNAFLRRFGRLALAAGGVPERSWGASAEFLAPLLAGGGNPRAWCGGDCVALAGRALAEAVAELQAAQGADPVAWRWGRAHVARFEHPLLRFIPVLGGLARLEAVTAGDGQTVNRGGMREDDGPLPYAHVHGAGLRLVADLASPDGVLAVIATGQSGNPLSRHWGDQVVRWRDGEMVRLGREAEGVSGRVRLGP